MTGEIFAMPSGAGLRIQPASFGDVMNLHNELVKALRGVGMADLDVNKIGVAMSSGDLGSAGSVLVDRVVAVASSPVVQECIMKCAESARYMPQGMTGPDTKIDMELFNNPKYGEKAREDFYKICAKILEVNMRPFMKALISLLKAVPPTVANVPVPESK